MCVTAPPRILANPKLGIAGHILVNDRESAITQNPEPLQLSSSRELATGGFGPQAKEFVRTVVEWAGSARDVSVFGWQAAWQDIRRTILWIGPSRVRLISCDRSEFR